MNRGAHALWLSAIVCGLCGPACQRLNPDWCSKAARCAVGEICDPTTNTCLRPEAGAADARPDLAPRDRGTERDQPGGDTALRDQGGVDRPQPCSGPTHGWSCVEGVAWRCGDQGASEIRRCPLGSCTQGHCEVPSTPTPCTKDGDCPGQWVCTLLLEGGTTPKQICAGPVKGTLSPALCTTGLDCATGLCTSGGQCYYACTMQTDCQVGYDCRSTTVAVEGVTVAVQSCEQL